MKIKICNRWTYFLRMVGRQFVFFAVGWDFKDGNFINFVLFNFEIEIYF